MWTSPSAGCVMLPLNEAFLVAALLLSWEGGWRGIEGGGEGGGEREGEREERRERGKRGRVLQFIDHSIS